MKRKTPPVPDQAASKKRKTGPLSVVVIGGDKTKNAKKAGVKKERIFQSAWLGTVVYNQVFEDDDWRYDIYDVLLQKMLRDFWSDPDNVWNVLKVNKGVTNKEWKAFKTYWETEKSPDTKHLHAHGVVNFVHSISIQLQYNKLSIELTDQFEKAVQEYNKDCEQDEAQKKFIVPEPKGKLYCHWDLITDDEWKTQLLEVENIKAYIVKNRKWMSQLKGTDKGMKILQKMDQMTSFVPDEMTQEIQEEEVVIPIDTKKRKQQTQQEDEEEEIVAGPPPKKTAIDVENRELVKKRMESMREKERALDEKIARIKKLQEAQEKKHDQLVKHLDNIQNPKMVKTSVVRGAGEEEDEESSSESESSSDSEEDPYPKNSFPKANRIHPGFYMDPPRSISKTPGQMHPKIPVQKTYVPNVDSYRVQQQGAGLHT